MEKHPFWCCACNILGSCRIPADVATRKFSGIQKKLLNSALPTAPGWAEISYLNDFSNTNSNIRSFLLGWVFAGLCEQYGEALTLAERASEFSDDKIFPLMAADSRKSILKSLVFGKRIRRKILDKLNFLKL